MKLHNTNIKTNDKIVDCSSLAKSEGIIIQISETSQTLTSFHPRQGASKVKIWTFDLFEKSLQDGTLQVIK